MKNINRALWGGLALLCLLWLIAEPTVFSSTTFFALREAMIQLSGLIAVGAMSVAMVLALRPRWPERWFGGLDKMYRLHKWFGITGLVAAVVHWLWVQGAKWAVGFGWVSRPTRGAPPAIDNTIEAFFRSLRGSAEGLGEWAFYAAVILIALALIKLFPYRLFFKTHRILAVVYLILAYHSAALVRFDYWTSPVGWVLAVLLVGGAYAAVIVLLRRVGTARQVHGKIATLQYYAGVRTLETEVDVPRGWPGHKPGQFAFATSDATEGAHPYTIASDWREDVHRITFITKELGDHTRTLAEKLSVGQDVTIEGPYGCFTFDDDRPHQIWVGGGIGITPFVARMKQMAQQALTPETTPRQTVDLFHTTADVDEKALAKLASDAKAANVRLHVLVDARDGRLSGERIRELVPQWHDASIWFCGPVGFGQAIRRDFASRGFPARRQFHQELFSMR